MRRNMGNGLQVVSGKGSGSGRAGIRYAAVALVILLFFVFQPIQGEAAGDDSSGPGYSLSLAAGSDKHGSSALRLIGAVWCPHWFDLGNDMVIRRRLELDLGVFDTRDTTVDIGIQPVFRLEYLGWSIRPYIDAGAGIRFLSRSNIRGRQMGGAFQFSLIGGAGIQLSDRFGMGYRFLHISNANIHKDNDGRDEHLLFLSWRF